jgi:hypothetical protein
MGLLDFSYSLLKKLLICPVALGSKADCLGGFSGSLGSFIEELTLEFSFGLEGFSLNLGTGS